MSMPLLAYFTADDVRALPADGKRYETVHGELLVTPAPSTMHQLVLGRIHQALTAYLTGNGLEQVLASPSDISWGADTLVQPDLFVADLRDALRSGDWSDIRSLYLAVEIVSPSSARTDRFTKRRLYQERGVPVYWVVDIDRRQVEVWTPDAMFPVTERHQLSWRHPDLGSDCVVDVMKLFAPIP
jgi:Uma2 family endonuclease